MNKLRWAILAGLFISFRLYSWDMGLLLNQKPLLEETGEDSSFSYSSSLIPWFSADIGDKTDLYFSVGATAEYDGEAEEKWQFLPELYRFEAVFRPGSRLSLGFGRLQFSDPLGYVAQGLFDGINANFIAGQADLSLGAFYTGFLYKETAKISMTPEDDANYNKELDYADLMDTYFAPKRAMGVIGLDVPGVLGEQSEFKVSGIFQFDLTGADTKLHSQYLSLLYRLPMTQNFTLSVGGTAELMEETYQDPSLGFAARGEGAWTLPTNIQDRLALGAVWASGEYSDTIRAFVPISTVSQGQVLRTRLAGIMQIQASYMARLVRSFSMDLEAAYFLRTDNLTFSDPDLDSSVDSYLLGGEFYGSFTWVPVSDVSFIAGGGVFLPGLGKAFVSDAKLKWLISLGLMIAF
jgi:hypothetical protein